MAEIAPPGSMRRPSGRIPKVTVSPGRAAPASTGADMCCPDDSPTVTPASPASTTLAGSMFMRGEPMARDEQVGGVMIQVER